MEKSSKSKLLKALLSLFIGGFVIWRVGVSEGGNVYGRNVQQVSGPRQSRKEAAKGNRKHSVQKAVHD
jgi:hypothetical protein